MAMRAIIVDDEPPARELLKEYLGEVDEIEVVAERGNGREAVQAINEEAPDLVFLDVQMPGLDGFDVLERLERIPTIIFSTAYDEYALQAFETGAVDYLLKPYKKERFRKAVRRALQQQGTTGDLTALLQAARRGEQETLDRLFVRSGDKIVPIETTEIRWIEAAGDYAKLHLSDRALLCNRGIGVLAERLDPERFVRVHRSAIIALPAVEYLTSDGQGGYRVRMQNGDTVRVSRSYAPELRTRMH